MQRHKSLSFPFLFRFLFFLLSCFFPFCFFPSLFFLFFLPIPFLHLFSLVFLFLLFHFCFSFFPLFFLCFSSSSSLVVLSSPGIYKAKRGRESYSTLCLFMTQGSGGRAATGQPPVKLVPPVFSSSGRPWVLLIFGFMLERERERERERRCRGIIFFFPCL